MFESIKKKFSKGKPSTTALSVAQQSSSGHVQPGSSISRETVEGVIVKLIDLAISHEAQALSLELEGRQPKYRFVAKDGRVGAGKFASQLIPFLNSFFQEKLCGEDSIHISNLAGREGRFKIVRSIEEIIIEVIHGDNIEKVKPIVATFGSKSQSVSHVAINKVFVIDDNATFAQVLTRFLSRMNIGCEYFKDGSSALQAIKERQPELIVSDVHMPGIDGVAFVQALRAIDEKEQVSVIMLTSDTDIEIKVRLLDLGVDAFVLKNEDPRVICAHVKHLLKKSSIVAKPMFREAA